MIDVLARDVFAAGDFRGLNRPPTSRCGIKPWPRSREPPSRNGTDLAQTPLETLLCTFLGCTNVVANVIAEDMGIEIDDMSLELVGHFDTQGFLGTAEIDTQFPQIELKADIKTDASPDQIDELKTRLATRCPVSAILRKSGTEVIETWNIVGG